jgi:hypothetical protein
MNILYVIILIVIFIVKLNTLFSNFAIVVYLCSYFKIL